MPLLGHPVENGSPEPVGGGWVAAGGGTVGCARDVGDDRGPAASEEFVGASGVVRAVTVKLVMLKHQ